MSNLLIIRTPFQAWLAEKVLVSEEVESFDLIYFTQNDSEEDKYYYQILSSKARLSSYYFVRPKKPTVLSPIIFKLKTRSWYQDNDYNKVICASIDALYITSLIKHYSYAELITFDDGTANINTSSPYFKPNNNKRVIFYRYILGSLSLEDMKRRIQRHYTLYQDMDNIVEPNKLRYLKSTTAQCLNTNADQGAKTYFIGCPFEKVLNREQIQRLTNTLSSFNINVYVKHPRERNKINIEAPYLNKKGRIAEEAILSDAQDKSIILVGWFSTVMLNMGALCNKRIVLLARDDPKTELYTKISVQAGCEVVLF